MVEVTDKRCFILWTEDKKGRISHDATAFITAHGAITEGERQKEKGLIKDYNYSVVMCPQIGGEPPKIKLLTDTTRDHSISL